MVRISLFYSVLHGFPNPITEYEKFKTWAKNCGRILRENFKREMHNILPNINDGIKNFPLI